jgi:predicted RNA-binding Zn-ribbon protein involved in translation (DUF1610 family)
MAYSVGLFHRPNGPQLFAQENLHKEASMSDAATTQFNCPSCGARYKVVRIEAPAGMGEHAISCLSCKAAIPSREGTMVLKYFQVERAPRHRRVPQPA